MHTAPIQAEIESRLAELEPDVELLACEQLGRERLRLVIDHPEGVDLDLCERVTRQLSDLLSRFGLEVSSPGPRRPLTKPDHFKAHVGRHARVRTRAPRDGQRSFTGELIDASDEEVTMAAGGGVVTIPYSEINRGNLAEGGDGAGPRSQRAGSVEGEDPYRGRSEDGHSER